MAGFDSYTGKKIWQRKLGTFINTRFASVDTTVSTQRIDNKTLAIEAKTGKILWTHTATSYDTIGFLEKAPVVIAKSLAFSVYSNGEVVALNTKTG